jgi:hypothetical protein
MAEQPVNAKEGTAPVQNEATMACPVCGAVVVQEKCKLICRSELCRGRVVMNCSEF